MQLPDLKDLEKQFSREIQTASSLDAIEAVRKKFVGRNGTLNALLKEIVKLPPEEKQKFGREINSLKGKIEESILKKSSEWENKKLEESLKSEKEDWTLPSFPLVLGKLHPITQVLEEITEIFARIGFTVAEGPEIESDENNFGALNIPEDHPARDLHDTFYVRTSTADKFLLRTHTSPVQIRVMRSKQPPIRIIAPGKVYRHEAVDATHSSVFHQVEGLVVDRAISFADLKGTLELFNREFFGGNVKTRFRPSYFPFVEPGAEVDISCTVCQSRSVGGSGCPVCKGSGWIEMLGAGMVHPNVFKAVGYDPEEVSGFAFGMGVERIVLVRYGIDDMRLLYENHLDFLSQF